MKNILHYSAVDLFLLDSLKTIMNAGEFREFRLVGGTALGLYRGHRESIDIDLFTDSVYGSVNFVDIDSFLRKTFNYVDAGEDGIAGPGKSYFIGKDPYASLKLDLYYTDKFINDPVSIEGLRIASIPDILAMKIESISNNGRKKDFWDIHEFIDDYPLTDIISFHKQRYPFSHDPELIIKSLSAFESADDDFEPRCLKGKHWGLIKLDFLEFIENLSPGEKDS
ncbi:MAG: nucleotidyl transferase AbiEii/AbiGii toxin family protein [Bacteroidales bacterium]|jgi:hypothetical protein|nr:nucleotidyl transferase AbiEii/AbiGii toxin family protein [Bacteroidales bacterium]